jgi:hypothetical protein
MTTSNGPSTPGAAHQRILDLAMRDPGFRASLLANPREAIQGALSVSIPEGAPIRVVEEQPGEVVLVVPARAMASRTSLSEEDLETVAGGAVYTYSLWGGNNCAC